MDTKPVRPLNKGGTHDIQPRRPATLSQAPPSTMQSVEPSSKNKRFFVAAAVLLALVLAGALWVWYERQSDSDLINTERYQAVTLSNGQVYFGKLSNASDKYMKIVDVYYLEADITGNNDEVMSGENPTLVKHGTELQNPEDEIIINKDDIILWENLKDSGKIVEAINNYKNQQGQ